MKKLRAWIFFVLFLFVTGCLVNDKLQSPEPVYAPISTSISPTLISSPTTSKQSLTPSQSVRTPTSINYTTPSKNPVPGIFLPNQDIYQLAERKDTLILPNLESRVLPLDNWNPFISGVSWYSGMMQILIEPLFILNVESGKVEGWLAESITNDKDFKTWTLRLRQGIAWNDGVSITSEDVKFSIEMLMKYSEFMHSEAISSVIKAMQIIDERTVVFELKEPNPIFPIKFLSSGINPSIIQIVPKHIWSTQDALSFKNFDTLKGYPVFSGPYQLVSVSGNMATFIRDDDWWAAKTGFQSLPKPLKIIFRSIQTDEIGMSLFNNNNLDLLVIKNHGDIRFIQINSNSELFWTAGMGNSYSLPCLFYLEFNTTRKPWNDSNMRLAVNSIISREEITSKFGGSSMPAISIFPQKPFLDRYIQLLRPFESAKSIYKSNLSVAKDLLEKNGWKKGKQYFEKEQNELKMNLMFAEDNVEQTIIAESIAAQLERFGIKVILNGLVSGIWQDSYTFGLFESRIGTSHCSSALDPWSILDTWSGRWVRPTGEPVRFNGERWNNPEYTLLVSEIGKYSPGSSIVDGLIFKAAAILINEMPSIPLILGKEIVIFNTKYWENWPTEKNNYIQPLIQSQSFLQVIANLESRR